MDRTDENPAWSKKYSEQFNAFFAEGRKKGINLSLEVAIEMARRMVESARDNDERGIALNLLGNALFTLGDRESGTSRLEEAVAAYREALKENTRERVPLDWAMTQNNLGNALARLGDREGGTARLDEAVIAFCDALLEYTRKRAPLEWAMTQNNLGNALRALGQRDSGTSRLEEAERESGTARLEEAVVTYREALKERTRERVPLDWAKTHMNLGGTLATLGERESGTARLEEAVAAFREALKENTRERVPLQ